MTRFKALCSRVWLPVELPARSGTAIAAVTPNVASTPKIQGLTVEE
jgi:hypothetical protein